MLLQILNIVTTSKSLSAHSIVLCFWSTTSSVKLTTSLALVAMIVVPLAPSFVAFLTSSIAAIISPVESINSSEISLIVD